MKEGTLGADEGGKVFLGVYPLFRIFAETGELCNCLIFAEKECFSVCAHTSTASFLLKKCLHPLLKCLDLPLHPCQNWRTQKSLSFSPSQIKWDESVVTNKQQQHDYI